MTDLTRQRKRKIGRDSIKNPQYNFRPEGQPSRQVRRHIGETQLDVVNNRKRTKGRNVQFQTIPLYEGKGHKRRIVGFKTIKHIIPTSYAIRVQKLIINNVAKG